MFSGADRRTPSVAVCATMVVRVTGATIVVVVAPCPQWWWWCPASHQPHQAATERVCSSQAAAAAVMLSKLSQLPGHHRSDNLLIARLDLLL